MFFGVAVNAPSEFFLASSVTARFGRLGAGFVGSWVVVGGAGSFSAAQGFGAVFVGVGVVTPRRRFDVASSDVGVDAPRGRFVFAFSGVGAGSDVGVDAPRGRFVVAFSDVGADAPLGRFVDASSCVGVGAPRGGFVGSLLPDVAPHNRVVGLTSFGGSGSSFSRVVRASVARVASAQMLCAWHWCCSGSLNKFGKCLLTSPPFATDECVLRVCEDQEIRGVPFMFQCMLLRVAEKPAWCGLRRLLLGAVFCLLVPRVFFSTLGSGGADAS